MITINLLPIDTFKEKFKGRIFLASLGLFLFIALVALFSFKTNVLDGNLERLTNDQKSQRARLNSLRTQVTEADKLTALTYKEWQRLMAIVDLEERRRDQTRLLVEMDSLLPKTNAWLLSLTHNQGVLNLEGISTDKETVSQFLTRLENAAYINRASVNLVEISQNMVINNIRLTKFKIRADTAFPQPVIIENGLPEYGLVAKKDFEALVKAAAPKLITDAATNVRRANRRGL